MNTAKRNQSKHNDNPHGGNNNNGGGKIRIGHMSYINTLPLYYFLKDDPNIEFVQGTPQELNAMLQSGDLTCSFASSVTYLAHKDKFDIMPFCIGAYHKVESVVLFSKEPIEFLHGKTVYLTTESATSTTLLKLIVQKFIGINPRYSDHINDKTNSTAQLLIGDEALKRYHSGQTPYSYDIAELWNLLTGHSCVFGLLFITKDTSVETRKYLYKVMTDAYEKHGDNLDACYDNLSSEQKFLPLEVTTNYWKLLEYQLNPIMISSLLGMFTMIENNILKHQDKPTPKLSLVDENGETYTI